MLLLGAGCLRKDDHAGAVDRVDGAHHLPHGALAAEASVRADAVPAAGPPVLRAAGIPTIHRVLPESGGQPTSLIFNAHDVGRWERGAPGFERFMLSLKKTGYSSGTFFRRTQARGGVSQYVWR